MPFVANSFVDGAAGGTPITAASLNNLEQGLVAADITTPGSAAAVSLAAQFALTTPTTALDSTVAGYVGTASATQTATDIRYGITFRPERFGAVGNGTTDDTVAVQAAITAQLNGGTPKGIVQLTRGATYLVSSLDIHSGCEIVGYGAVIARPASMPNGTRTLTNQNRVPASSTTDASRIVLRGFTVDGNLANQGPYLAHQLEQSSLIFIMGNTANTGRQPVLIEDVYVKNVPADGISISANTAFVLKNIRATDCFRGGITPFGGYSTVIIDGFWGDGSITGASLHMEQDVTGYGGSVRCDMSARNILIDTPYPTSTTGIYLNAYAGSQVAVDNVQCASGLSVVGGLAASGYGRIRINNSVFDVYDGTNFRNNIAGAADVSFDNCKFRWNNPTGTAITTGKGLYVIASPTVVDFHNQPGLRFNNCDFIIGTTISGDVVDAVYLSSAASSINEAPITVNGGSFSTGYRNAVLLIQGGVVNIKNHVHVAAACLLSVTYGTAIAWRATIGQVDLASTVTTYMDMANGDPNSTIIHQGTLIDETFNVMTSQYGMTTNTMRGGRIIMMTAAPTTSTPGLRGDMVILKTPVTGSAYEWICTTAGIAASAQVWKISKTLAA